MKKTPPSPPGPILVAARLLDAVASWAYQCADRPHLSVVAFMGGEMVATDGHRLVRMPVAGLGDRRFGIWAPDAAMALRAFGPRAILDIDPASGRIAIGDRNREPILTVKAHDIDGYPPIDEIMNKDRRGNAPDGIVLNARYLADVQRIAEIIDPADSTIRIVSWGDKLDPLIMEGPRGSRYLLMPQRPDSIELQDIEERP